MVRVFFFFISVLFSKSIIAEDYTLDAGDQIRITVLNESELTLSTQVDKTGRFSYPFLGAISAKGKTTVELENDIALGLKDGFLVEPIVNISIIKYRDFFIRGQVKSPGGYPYQPFLTVMKATSLAGGLNGRANKDKIYIVRNGKEISNKELVDLDTLVFPGDVIIVEESFF